MKYGTRQDIYFLIIIDHRGEEPKAYYRYKYNVIFDNQSLPAVLGEKLINTWTKLREWIIAEKFCKADTIPFELFYREARKVKHTFVVHIDNGPLDKFRIEKVKMDSVDVWNSFRNEK